jgi:hypothetical protein
MIYIYTNNMCQSFYKECKQILNPLKQHGWVFLNIHNNDEILMQKQYHELNEIKININEQDIEFVLPIKNSQYSYFKRLHNSNDSLLFLKKYITYI